MTSTLTSIEELMPLTYDRSNITDHTLDDNDLARRCPLDNGRHSASSKFSLESLDSLPPELLCMILAQTDIQSLTNFRRVNQRAMELTDSLPQYKPLIAYAPDLIRGILTIGTGKWISCQDLFDTFCTADCETCGDFGGYIYIITCKRVCFLCLSEESRYLPLLRRDVSNKFGLNHKIISKLPTMKSLPGRYAPNDRSSRARWVLIDSESARQAAIKAHGSVSAVEQHMSILVAKGLKQWRERSSQTVEGTSRKSLRQPWREAWDGQSSNPRRFMAIIRTPRWDRSTESLDWGFHCVGCIKHHRCRPLHWRRKFSTTQFIEHIRQCGAIQDGVHCTA